MTSVPRIRSLLLAAPLLFGAGLASAATHRTLEAKIPADRLQEVSLEAGVGEVTIRPSNDRFVHVRVDLRTRDRFFGVGKADRRQVDEATLSTNLVSGRLSLEVATPRRTNRGFSEDWTVELPAGTDLDLEVGVGDVSVEGLSGTIGVELGVGDITVTGLDTDFGEIDLACGVGEASLRQPGGRRIRDSVLGNEVESSGSGRSQLHVELGVGDIDVRLR